jgi:PEP-CTERM motif
MRRSICLLWLLVFGGCLAAQADPLVTGTINYVFHNGDDTSSSTFSFDPDKLFFYLQPDYEGDFLYPLVQQPEFPSPGSFDTVDFFGSSLAFTNFGPNFSYDFEIDFSPGTCQDIPPLAGTGAVPTFTTMTCNQVSGGGFGGGPPEEQINYITSVDFVVEGGATTPEPSSFILLGTGLAGLIQIGFSRMRAARRAS